MSPESSQYSASCCCGRWCPLLFLPSFLPGPRELTARLLVVYSEAAAYVVVWDTLRRIILGLLASMIIGGILGLIMGLHRHVEAFLDGWIMVALTFPAVCWAFLAVLWFGLSDVGPIFTTVLIVFPFVALTSGKAPRPSTRKSSTWPRCTRRTGI